MILFPSIYLYLLYSFYLSSSRISGFNLFDARGQSSVWKEHEYDIGLLLLSVLTKYVSSEKKIKLLCMFFFPNHYPPFPTLLIFILYVSGSSSTNLVGKMDRVWRCFKSPGGGFFHASVFNIF